MKKKLEGGNEKKDWGVFVYTDDGHCVDSWELLDMTQSEASVIAEQQVKAKHPTLDDWRLLEKMNPAKEL